MPGFPAARSTGDHLMGSLTWDHCSLCSPHDEFRKVDLISDRSECFLLSSELFLLVLMVGSPLPQALNRLAPSVVGRLGPFPSCWDPTGLLLLDSQLPGLGDGLSLLAPLVAASLGLPSVGVTTQEAEQLNWWAWCPNCWCQRPG